MHQLGKTILVRVIGTRLPATSRIRYCASASDRASTGKESVRVNMISKELQGVLHQTLGNLQVAIFLDQFDRRFVLFEVDDAIRALIEM